VPKPLRDKNAVACSMRPVAIVFFSSLFAVMALLMATVASGFAPPIATVEVVAR
jgi:hypothetical protein